MIVRTCRKIYFAIKQIRFYIVNSIIEFHRILSLASEFTKSSAKNTKKVKERRFEKRERVSKLCKFLREFLDEKLGRKGTFRISLPSFYLWLHMCIVCVALLVKIKSDTSNPPNCAHLTYFRRRRIRSGTGIDLVILFSNESDSIQCVQRITISEIAGWHDDGCKRS